MRVGRRAMGVLFDVARDEFAILPRDGSDFCPRQPGGREVPLGFEVAVTHGGVREDFREQRLRGIAVTGTRIDLLAVLDVAEPAAPGAAAASEVEDPEQAA